jgi:hypothetical protein
MPPLGFIAPFLYQAYEMSPEAFNDVVYGDNVSWLGLGLDLGLELGSYEMTPDAFNDVVYGDNMSGVVA